MFINKERKMFKHKIFFIILGLLLIFSPLLISCNGQQDVEEPTEEVVVLTFGAWRSDDVVQMERILAKFHDSHPNIIVKFDPTDPPEYDAATRTQLVTGTGTDLYYLRSSGISFDLYNEGHFVAIDDLPGLDNITPEAIKTWTADDGRVFGVGYIATSTSIYYNIDVFDELGLEVPKTWGSLLDAAQIIQNAGYTPFANASGDSWTIGTLLIQNWIPNIIGGSQGREAYQSGEKCLYDDNWVRVYQHVADIAPYLPEGQQALTYYDSQQLFLMGEAVMWFGGSWDIPQFELEEPGFNWSVFPIPPMSLGDPTYLLWELDAGVGINAASAHIEEAKIFLSWLTTKESATLLASELPGFFPMIKDAITIDNPYAQAFLDMRANVDGTDIRFYMPAGQPTAYSLFMDNAIKILRAEMTPEEAAQSLYDGVSSWHEGQANCSP
jgi:raffinose/stachyose/melibiose transport system substrate-binding protein